MVAFARELSAAANFATAAEICHTARRGVPLALRGAEREGYYLGHGLADLITLFAPDRIALGGGVMKSSFLFTATAHKATRKICTQVLAETTQIALASLGPGAGLLGAAQGWLLRNR